MDSHASGFWYSLGYARISGGIVILLVSVAWDKVCLLVKLGGLGIRSVASFNQALLGK